jgi:hypothetical protein
MPPKSYFGYVEREADSYVNWADVGRTITNTVDEIDRVRTEKKAAIDAAYKEGLEFINDQPKGENEEVTGLTMDLAYNSAENLKIQYNLLKSGKLQTKDFAAYVQTQNDNVKGFYETVGTIQQSFKERQDRMKAEDSQDIELYAGEELEKYGKLSNLQAFYNVNGSLTFGLKGEPDKDGVRKVLPGSQNIMSVNQLKGAVDAKYDRYKYDPDLTTWVEGLGDQLNSYREIGTRMKAGSITEIVDITKDEITSRAKELRLSEDEVKRLTATGNSFKAAEKAFIDARLENKYNLSSILTNNLGKKITENAEEAKKDPNKILFTKDGNGVYNPVPSPEQKTEAENFLRGQLRAKLDNKIGIKTYTDVAQDQPKATAVDYQWTKDIEKVKDVATLLGEIYYGTPQERESALKDINFMNNVAKAYFNTNGEFVVITKEGKIEKLAFSDSYGGNKHSGKEFGAKDAVGAFVTAITGGQISREEAKKLVPNKPLNRDFSQLQLENERAMQIQSRLAEIETELKKSNTGGSAALNWEKTQLSNELGAIKSGGGTTGGTPNPAP